VECARFGGGSGGRGILTAVLLKIAIFWYVTSYGLAECPMFRSSLRLLLWGQEESKKRGIRLGLLDFEDECPSIRRDVRKCLPMCTAQRSRSSESSVQEEFRLTLKKKGVPLCSHNRMGIAVQDELRVSV